MKAFWTSLLQRPVALVGHAFVGFSVPWTTTAALTHFFGWSALRDGTWLMAIVVTSLSYSLYKLWRPSRVMITIPMTNVSIEVAFGDIFEQEGITVIPVNEFFDSELGLPVSPKSVHGIFLQRCFGGHGDAFDRQIAARLATVHPTQVARNRGKLDRFPLGSCALVEASGKQYLAFAFTHTDAKTCKASADVPQMFEALSGLWKAARDESGGEVLNLPLIGGGLSGVGLPPQDLVNILILSFLDATRRQVIVQKIRIILTWDKLNAVDLRELKRSWEAK